MQHYYTTKVHCVGSKAEFIMLKVFDQEGNQIRARSGKKWGYIRTIIEAGNLLPLSAKK